MALTPLIQPRPSDLDHVKWLADEGLSNFSGKRCLDLGCGSGFLSERQALAGSSLAVGIDVVAVSYPETNPFAGAKAPFFLQADLNNVSWLPTGFSDGQMQGFDLITAFDIIEDLDSPWVFLSVCRTLLSSTGSLVLTTPNASGWDRRLRPNRWSGESDPHHKILFTPFTLNFVLQRAGYRVDHLGAPMRKLGALGRKIGPIGGQIVAAASGAQKSH